MPVLHPFNRLCLFLVSQISNFFQPATCGLLAEDPLLGVQCTLSPFHERQPEYMDVDEQQVLAHFFKPKFGSCVINNRYD